MLFIQYCLTIISKIKCRFRGHDFKGVEKYLLPREACTCCKMEIVQTPNGKWYEEESYEEFKR